MNYTIKIIKSLEVLDVLVDRVNEIVKPKADFLEPC